MLIAAMYVLRKTPEGTITIKVNEPRPEVIVDGDRLTVSWNAAGKVAELHVKPGSRKIELKKNGFKAIGEEIEVEDGVKCLLLARLEPDVQPPNPAEQLAAKPATEAPAAAKRKSVEAPESSGRPDLRGGGAVWFSSVAISGRL